MINPLNIYCLLNFRKTGLSHSFNLEKMSALAKTSHRHMGYNSPTTEF